MKLLRMLCIAALVVAVAAPVYAEVQNIKVSGDILVRGVYREDYDRDDDATDGNNDSAGLYNTVTRLKVDADLTDNVATTVRVGNERDWDIEGAANTDINLDLASVTIKELVYAPLSVTVGRQEIKLGSGLVIADANRPNLSPARIVNTDPDGDAAAALAVIGPMVGVDGNSVNIETGTMSAAGWTGPDGTLRAGYGDLTMKKAFDAVTACLDYDNWVIDIAVIKLDETAAASNDDDLYAVNISYDFENDYNAGIEGYVVANRDDVFNRWIRSVDAGQTIRRYNESELYVIGVNGTIDPVADLNLKAELAMQTGEIRDNILDVGSQVVTGTTRIRDREAWAFDVDGSYTWSDSAYEPMVNVGYSYRSGEESGNGGDYELWEPLFTDQVRGEIAKVMLNGPNNGNTSNASILTLGGCLKPVDKLTLGLNYYRSWLDEEMPTTIAGNGMLTGRTDDDSLADELNVNLTYDYSEDVSFGLLGAILWPGDSFDAANAAGVTANDTAYEAVGSVKVTF